jgi:hypothetical protein
MTGIEDWRLGPALAFLGGFLFQASCSLANGPTCRPSSAGFW